MIPLFEQYPRLQDALPHAGLADLPTPVPQLARLGAELGVGRLYMKRDGQTGIPFGGNKVRKLEFLLGEALRREATTVMTFGAAGSNHALATAIYARKLGLHSISMLTPQPNATYVRRNLLMSFAQDAGLRSYRDGKAARRGAAWLRWWGRLRRRGPLMVIPPGGSTPVGATGYVNAALELKAQIDRRELPEPDRIYAPLGTAGTVAGLLVGLRAANLKAQVVAVQVAGLNFMPPGRLEQLCAQTSAFLREADPSFPAFDWGDAGVTVVTDMLGPGYAKFTEEGVAAVARMMELEGIRLDGTYTGKTLAGLARDARDGALRDEVVLFWNTLNARDFSDAIAGLDYHLLPRPFHRYFEQDVQPLDPEAETAKARV